MSQFFPKIYGTPNANVKVELDPYICEVKSDMKKQQQLISKKIDLITLKPDVDKSDIDKFKTIPKN